MSDVRLTVAVVGGGKVGGGLADRWRAAGHTVQVVGRNDAIDPAADVVLLAVPGDVATRVAAARAQELAGRTLIDATNDVSGDRGVLAQQIAEAAPGAKVTKAFNTVFAAIYDEVSAHPGAADMGWCGDDPLARSHTAQLIVDAGFRPIDCGPLSAAADLEGFARLVIRTAYAVGRGPFGYRFAPVTELAAPTTRGDGPRGR